MAGERNYCASCGAELDPVVAECVECGYEPDSGKNPLLAAVLTLLITGAGHIYAGKALRGVGWFVGSIAGAVVLVVLDPALGVLSICFPVAGAFDASVQTE